jgi:Hemingway/CFA97
MFPSINQRNERKGYNKIQYERHLYRIDEALPTIDTNNKILEDEIASIDSKWQDCNTFRIKRIQRENQELLYNLAKVYQQSNLDNKLSKRIESVREFKKKLFVTSQKNKINKINQSNKLLLERIQNVKSSFC